jgi:threonine/homoserine/homoserine lactone efflux protein
VIEPSRLAAFVAAAVVLIAIPGPSVLFIVARGVAHGRRAALATVIGNELGGLTQAMAVALGVGAVVRQSLVVFTVMKLAGAAYLVVLGVRALPRRGTLARVTAPVSLSPAALVRQGYMVGVTNPKTTLFFLAVLPQFVTPSGGNATVQLVVLGLVFVAIATVLDSLYGLAAGQMRRWLDGSPRRLAAVGGASGVVMIGLGVRLALTGRHD